MPGYASFDLVGVQPITSFWDLDTTPPGGALAQPFVQAGQLICGGDLYWGTGEFMMCKAGGTIRQFGVCTILPTFNVTTLQWEWITAEAPNTANLGRALGIAMHNATVGQYVWLQVSGVTPVNCQASVAADTTFGIAAAGQGGANSAGKQILNARIVAAGATTVVKAGSYAPNGSTILAVQNCDGWFPGIYLSGTGIQATTTATKIDINNRTVTLSLATNATVNGSITGTYNNATIFYNVAHLNRSFAQGAIT
jgi:hypothetical protein